MIKTLFIILHQYTYVSHPCQIEHKTLFLKIELNAFSNRGHIYSHSEKNYSNI